MMTSHLQESLENLRLRATCAICTELYTKPKQLPNCSHVFCLSCIKKYMRAKLPGNFPPCPVCRAPISRAIRNIDLLEPARAEEDIIEFVRPYENCDLCKKRERPTMRCLECSGLVCESCLVVHNKLQSHHTVVSIFGAGAVVQKPGIKNECHVHPNQTLDMYCIMCNAMLCHYCDKYAHVACTSEYEEFDSYRKKLSSSSKLLQEFVYSSVERKNVVTRLDRKMHRMRSEQTAWLESLFTMLHIPTSPTFTTNSHSDQAKDRLQHLRAPNNFENIVISTPAALKVVQIHEFSAFARSVMRDLMEELEKDVQFYEEYIERLENIVGSEIEQPEQNERKIALENEIHKLVETGKMIAASIRLMDNSTDIEVTESALRKEMASLQFFRFRKTFSMDVRCIELKRESVKDTKSIIRQRAFCAIKEHIKSEACFLLVDRVEVAADLFSASYLRDGNLETDRLETINNTAADATGTAEQINVAEYKLVVNTINCLDVKNSNEYSETSKTCDFSMVNNTLYENKFSKDPQRMQVLVKGGIAMTLRIISKAGFTGDHFSDAIEKKCLDRCKYSKTRSYINIVTTHVSSNLKYQTYMKNVFVAAPFTYRSDIIFRVGDIEMTESPPIICLIGTRSIDCGIETLFLACDGNNSPEFTNGISVMTKIARFKQKDFSCTRGTTVSNISVYKDKTGLYCLCKGQAYNGSSLVTYFTNLVGFGNATVYCIPKDGPDIPILVTCFKAELLCEMKGGVFYVIRDQEESGGIVIRVGILTKDNVLTNKTIFTINEYDSPVKTDRLRPLTMAESNREELVIACTVDGDASKLAMIVPMKETVEILEIQYPDPECNAGEIVDLEMDSDGNIMCIFRDIYGKIWRVITKYMMP